MADKKRMKLFRMLAAPFAEDAALFIPDCLGYFSRFLDPRHDDFGRNFTTCFLVDAEGQVAIFSNRWEFDYVPYNILFHLEQYNQCTRLLFPGAEEEWPELPEIAWDEKRHRNMCALQEYADGRVSGRKVCALLRRGRLFESLEMLFSLLSAYRVLCCEKELLQERLRIWRDFKREYREKGVYVFEPHPELKTLVKISTPKASCGEQVAQLARTIGQRVPFSFRDVTCIDSDCLRKLWIAQVREDWAGGRHEGPELPLRSVTPQK